MVFPIHAEVAPIRFDEHGVARVGGTRVTLETILWTYQQGSSAEQIHESFPTVSLADIHAVLAYYLHHREEVDAYLREVERNGDELRRQVEAEFPQIGLREKLLARRKEIYGE